MKKLVFLMLIFSLFCFSGCGKAEEKISNDFIMISLSSNQDGEISQYVNFGVNSQKIKEKSKNNEEYLSFVANLIENVKKIRENYLYSIALKYLNSPEEKYKINDGVVLSNVAYFAESDSVGFVIKFKNNDSWNFYHTENNESSNKKKTNNLFLTKVMTKSQFVFSNKIEGENITIGQKYRNLYVSSANSLSFYNDLKNYSPDLVYSFSSTYGKLHSNANIQFSQSNLNYHVWKVNYSYLDDNSEVILWYNQINYGMWYLTAIIVILVPTITILIIYAIKKQRLKSKRTE